MRNNGAKQETAETGADFRGSTDAATPLAFWMGLATSVKASRLPPVTSPDLNALSEECSTGTLRVTLPVDSGEWSLYPRSSMSGQQETKRRMFLRCSATLRSI